MNEVTRLNQVNNKSIAVKLFVTVYLLCLFFMDSTSHGVFTGTNRFQYLSYAIVENQTIDISIVEEQYGETVEAYEVNGKRVQIINPGLGLLMSPVYALSSSMGIEDYIEGTIGNQWITPYRGLLFALIINATMAAIFVTSLWLIFRWLGLSIKLSMSIAIGVGWGSMAAYYFTAGTNVQTAVETALSTLAWLFIIGLDRGIKIKYHAFWSGFFMGIAILVNVPAVITAMCTMLYIFYVYRSKTLSFIIGLIPGIIILLIYQWIALGNPFLDVPFAYFQSKGLYSNPDDVSFIQVALEFLIGWHQGIIWYFPLLVVMFIGIRRLKTNKHLTIVCLTLMFLHWMFATWYTHLWIQTEQMLSFYPWYATPGPGGPRYLLPAVPFVAILISQIDYRYLYLRTFAVWLGVLGMCLNIPVLMYPAGGPVFRSFILMMKYGLQVPLAKIVVNYTQNEFKLFTVETTYVITWLVVLIGALLWIWGINRFRDWIFDDCECRE